MAALDFGMAKARGLVAPIKEAEADLIKQAGGRNIFKSEDWWNDQYNKTIRQGISETYSERVNYNPLSSGGYSNIGGTNAFGMPQAVQRPQYVTKVRQKDLTQAQLDSIIAASKASQKKSKSELESTKAAQKRLSRGTGGLLAKAPIPGTEGMATGMPALGETGLGIVGSMLGVGTEL